MQAILSNFKKTRIFFQRRFLIETVTLSEIEDGDNVRRNGDNSCKDKNVASNDQLNQERIVGDLDKSDSRLTSCDDYICCCNESNGR